MTPATMSSPAVAQATQAEGDMVEVLAQNLLFVDRGFFGDVTLVRAGEEIDPGWFCGDCPAIFVGSPRAMEAADTFATMRMLGIPFYIIGLGMLLTDSIGIFGSDAFSVSGCPTNLWRGLLAGGFATGMVGGLLVRGASAWLSDAANYYNDDVLAAARSARPLPLGVGLAALPGGAAVMMGGPM